MSNLNREEGLVKLVDDYGRNIIEAVNRTDVSIVNMYLYCGLRWGAERPEVVTPNCRPGQIYAVVLCFKVEVDKEEMGVSSTRVL